MLRDQQKHSLDKSVSNWIVYSPSYHSKCSLIVGDMQLYQHEYSEYDLNMYFHVNTLREAKRHTDVHTHTSVQECQVGYLMIASSPQALNK